MTAILPGTPVAISERVAAAHHSPPATLQRPESAAEHVRNALQLVMHADRTTVSGRVALTAEEYAGVCYRLERAIAQLEGRVA